METKSVTVTKTKEEIEAESAIATQQGLVELGRILHEKEAQKRNFDKIYQNLLKYQQESKGIIDFDVDLINKDFNLDVYVQKSLEKYKKNNSFSNINFDSSLKDNIYTDTLKLNILNEMTKKLLLEQEMETDKAIQISKETSEQSDEYLEEIEKLEEDKKKSDDKLALRIINLRTKCIYKNKLLFWHRFVMLILCYTVFMSLPSTINQVIFVLNTIFVIIKFLMDYTLYSCWYSYRLCVDFGMFPILIGCLFGVIGVLYYDFKNKKDIINKKG